MEKMLGVHGPACKLQFVKKSFINNFEGLR